MVRDGYSFIGVTAFVTLLAGGMGYQLKSIPALIVCIFCFTLTLFFAYFFRNPKRKISAGEHDILSPGDGRIVSIVEVDEESFFKSKVTRISIFMSVFDVHVNRIPISGKVEHLKYRPGTFKAAFKEEASLKNEHTEIGIVSGNKKILFKQIAGILARRIVCSLSKGQSVQQGERFGLIRFGSRIDVIVPPDTEILVNTGKKVYGGKTCLGKFHHEE